MQGGRVLRRLQSILKWLAEHIYVRNRNLNDDEEAKPIPSVEAGVKVEF